MVRSKNISVGRRRSPVRSSKTHVFPYKALEPIIEVLPSGYLVVKPYKGEEAAQIGIQEYPQEVVDRLREIQNTLELINQNRTPDLEPLLRAFSPERIIQSEERLEGVINRFISELPVFKQEVREELARGRELTEELIKGTLRDFVRDQIEQLSSISRLPMEELNIRIETLREVINSFEVGPELDARFSDLKTRLENSVSLLFTTQLESLKSELVNREFVKISDRINTLENLVREMSVSDVTREMVSRMNSLITEGNELQVEVRSRLQSMYETLSTARLSEPILEKLSLMERSNLISLETLYRNIKEEIGNLQLPGNYEDIRRYLETRLTMDVAKPLLDKLDSLKPNQETIIREQGTIRQLIQDVLGLRITETLTSKLDTVERNLTNSNRETLELVRTIITSATTPLTSKLDDLEERLRVMDLAGVRTQLDSLNETLQVISRKELNTDVLKRLTSIEIQLMNLPKTEVPAMDMSFVVDIRDRLDLLKTLIENYKSGNQDDITMIRNMLSTLETMKPDLEPLLAELLAMKSDFQKEFERQRVGMDGKLDELRTMFNDGYREINDKLIPLNQLSGVTSLEQNLGNNIRDTEMAVNDKLEKMLQTLTMKMDEQETELRDLISKLEVSKPEVPGEIIETGASQIEELKERLREAEVARDRVMIDLRDKTRQQEILKTDYETAVDKLEEQNRVIVQIEDILNSYADSIPQFSEMTLEAKVDEVLNFINRDCETTRPQRVVVSGNLAELLTMTPEQEARLREIQKEEVDRVTGISRELYESYEKIRKTLHNSIYIHQLRNEILTDFPERELSSTSLRANFLERDNVGKFTIVDAFSPVREPSRDPKLLGLILASTLYRIFQLDGTISLLTLIDNRGPNPAITQSLRQICERYGKKVNGTMLYTMDDMFMVQISLIRDIRKYVLDTKRSGVDLAYGLETRYVLLDVFIRAYSESVYGLINLADRFRTSEAAPLNKTSPTIISYLRVRADAPDYVIDPRYYMKVDSRRTKILMGHEPYVESSLAVKKYDREPYQFDIYGPFDRVFIPTDTNNHMSENVPEILEVLEQGKNLCIIALGPSGSGKTSTLLYFRGSKTTSAEYGVIPLALGSLSSRFTSAEVKAYEFRNNYERRPDTSDPYWKTHEVFDKVVNFRRSGRSWISEGSENSGKILNYETTIDNPVCEVSKPFSRPLTTFKFGKLDISEFMSKLIDLRLNCGTPNNPVSSRTHLFITIKFGNGPTLIIADLAGREKVFDCTSEAVLQTIALNPLYPNLNTLYSSPTETDPERFDSETVLGKQVGKFSPLEPLNNVKLLGALNSIRENDLNDPNPNLKRFIDVTSMDQYFKTPYLGYDQRNPATSYVLEPNTKNVVQKFYRVMEVIFSHVLARGYPTEIETRISNLTNQSRVVQERLEKMPPEDIRQRVYQIMKYFSEASQNIIDQQNITVMSQMKRISLKTGAPEQELNRAVKYVIPVLELVLVLKYLENVLKSSAGRVCDIRSSETGFINRSLDEFTTLVSSVSNANAEYGPLVHEQCLPISCAFAGLDCLIPSKNLPRDIEPSAVKTVLDSVIGTELSVDNITFCTFMVLNYTPRPRDEKSFRPLFDASETLLQPVTEAFDNAVHQPYILQPVRTGGDTLPTLWNRFLQIYDSELDIRLEFRNRKEYLGVNPSKMMTEGYRVSAYGKSVENWLTMRDISQRMITVVEGYRGVDHMKLREEFNVISQIRDLIKDCKIRNQDTIPGSLIMVDGMVKRYLQPLVCTATSETTVLNSVSEKWMSL